MEENEKACYEIIERIKTEKVDDATLQRIKTKIRAGLIRQLDSNSGLARELTSYYVNYGDWRKLFTGLDEIEKVTADDVQRVAKQYLVPQTRTVAYTVQGGRQRDQIELSRVANPAPRLAGRANRGASGPGAAILQGPEVSARCPR